MNRIEKLFQAKTDHVLSVYFTAGHPAPESTGKVIKSLQRAGADMIEIGIPFSDPMADGQVIQESSHKALKNGMSLRKLFEQINNIREDIEIPLLLMGYLNPVLQYGMENFCRDCRKTGIDGVILPDLPLDVFCADYKKIFVDSGIANVMLITPQTTIERIRIIDEESTGFIYMVSASSTTGIKGSFTNGQIDYFRRINGMRLNNPVMAGFGISNNETFETVCGFANGAIIGSAFVKMLDESTNIEKDIADFIKNIRK